MSQINLRGIVVVDLSRFPSLSTCPGTDSREMSGCTGNHPPILEAIEIVPTIVIRSTANAMAGLPESPLLFSFLATCRLKPTAPVGTNRRCPPDWDRIHHRPLLCRPTAAAMGMLGCRAIDHLRGSTWQHGQPVAGELFRAPLCGVLAAKLLVQVSTKMLNSIWCPMSERRSVLTY